MNAAEHAGSDPNESASPALEVHARTSAEVASRVGGVEIENVALTQAPQLDNSSDFRQMTERLVVSQVVVESMQARGDLRLDEMLTEMLDQLVAEGKVDGLMIGSEEGFVVAQSARMQQPEVLAAIGALFEQTVRRVQQERIVESMEEMVLRGFSGEQVVMRYFPGMEKRFFLVSLAKEPCAYRRVTTRALKRCGDLLARALGLRPARRPAVAVPAPPSPSVEPLAGVQASSSELPAGALPSIPATTYEILPSDGVEGMCDQTPSKQKE